MFMKGFVKLNQPKPLDLKHLTLRNVQSVMLQVHLHILLNDIILNVTFKFHM